MENFRIREWDESYVRGENCILFPKEEIVKFLNRFVRKKTPHGLYKILPNEKLRGLDFCSTRESVYELIESTNWSIQWAQITTQKSFFGEHLDSRYFIIFSKNNV